MRENEIKCGDVVIYERNTDYFSKGIILFKDGCSGQPFILDMEDLLSDIWMPRWCLYEEIDCIIGHIDLVKTIINGHNASIKEIDQ